MRSFAALILLLAALASAQTQPTGM